MANHKLTTTELNQVKAHLQEGSNADGSRKFVVKSPLGNFVFCSKLDANGFKSFYDAATKYYPD
jgi:hypothetical protein